MESKNGPWVDPYEVDKPIVCLFGLLEGTLGLILLRPSGVVYWNQAGGVNCLQPAEEGVFVPIGSPEQERAICDYILEEKYGQSGASHLDLEDADRIDEILARSQYTTCLKVDRARIRDSCEAWVYVTVGDHPQAPQLGTFRGPLTRIYGFGPCNGVLTWVNSD